MKRLVLFAIILTAVVSACSKEVGAPAVLPAEEIGYLFPQAGAPAENTTYTIISYRLGYATDPDVSGSQRPEGYYAYQDGAVGNVLVPADVDASYAFVARNNAKGQALTAGNFQTALISPAVKLESTPIINGTSLWSKRVRFKKDQQIMASDTFFMAVSGYQLFQIPDNLPIRDIRSKVVFDIYQGASSAFTISNCKLLNAGNDGWYHPLLGVTDISYGTVGQPDFSYTSGDEQTCPMVSTGNAPAADTKMYSSGDVYVFAADYSSEQTLSLGLLFDLSMDSYSVPVNIPISIKMEMSKRYLFKLTVKSKIIRLSYVVTDWFDEYTDDRDIGGPDVEIHLGTWDAGNWIAGGGGSGDIGEVNP